MRCQNCCTELRADDGCPKCELYNAAVAAQGAAARALAESRVPGLKPEDRTWVNQYGFFAQCETTVRVGTDEEAKPFAELTTNALAAHSEQVLAELPETKPTAWQRLSAWLVAEPGRSYDRSTDGHFAAHGHGLFWLIDDEAVFAKGEGPTLDDALANAMEKLP